MNKAVKEPFALNYGSYEEAQHFLDNRTLNTVAEFTVNWEAIKIYCSLEEDGNASYWDEEYARQQWGGIVAPPGLLLTWAMSLQWHPKKERSHHFIAVIVPLPGNTLINVATKTEYERHLFLGDRVHVEDRLIDISHEKNTRLGIGHFLTTQAKFTNQKDELIAIQTNQLFRYNAHEE